jgi:hypothetical protein
MKKLIFIGTFSLFLLGCGSDYEKSTIEIIKYDEQLVKNIRTVYDSTITENPMREDFWKIECYLKDSIESRIMTDSLGNIVAISQFTNNIRTFVEEYFPNGQLRVKHEFPPGEIDGPVTAYYQNGQIKSTGQWKDFKQVGEWKYYNPRGQLISIEWYSDKGALERNKKIIN